MLLWSDWSATGINDAGAANDATAEFDLLRAVREVIRHFGSCTVRGR